MIRYTLYGSKSCVKSQLAKKLMDLMEMEYLYRDVEDAEHLAGYHFNIDDCSGDSSDLP
ncbi:MAG: hypothetical protein QME49_07090 [bacterium]|nr:hypothetical protein [bacterium]